MKSSWDKVAALRSLRVPEQANRREVRAQCLYPARCASSKLPNEQG